MKKTRNPKIPKSLTDEPRSEYRFDYSKAKPNRFANRDKEGQIVVMLDPDIAKVFKTSKAVNKALRALITALPRS